jgi:hypothetical protein
VTGISFKMFVANTRKSPWRFHIARSFSGMMDSLLSPEILLRLVSSNSHLHLRGTNWCNWAAGRGARLVHDCSGTIANAAMTAVLCINQEVLDKNLSDGGTAHIFLATAVTDKNH